MYYKVWAENRAFQDRHEVEASYVVYPKAKNLRIYESPVK